MKSILVVFCSKRQLALGDVKFRILGFKISTGESHYYCPACKSRMIIKRGKIIAPHFAHKTKGQCDPWYTGKMSQWHRKLQNKFPPDMQEVILWNDDNTEYHVADGIYGYL